ncbi:hypothetical protein AVEN_65577-1 [Araneus ventricosus]|uniref:Uncharacterized protein n=1 Tax=Araneus ventricosus TaxID=182803 RepID=A0A4Y2S107_ARAVE|nr:hypothetical protein AVEN_65577-1 [Araneus ventricosus]
MTQNSIPLMMRIVWDLLHAKSYVVAKRPPAGVVRNFGEEVPDQVSFSSSNSVSKLRSQSQNRPSVASKLDVNITKPNADLYVNLNGVNALAAKI